MKQRFTRKFKAWLLPASLLLAFLIHFPVFAQETPFKKGVNLSNWFQANSARQISFSRYTKKDFEQIKSLGCDVIRLPINLHGMTKGAPNYTLDPLFLSFLDQAVTWAEELDLHLILDNHSFDPLDNTQPSVEGILEKVWTQMAQHYKDRSDKVYFEILNEPHGISDAQWNAIQGRIIQVIRRHDTRHTLIVGATNFNSYQNLAQVPVYPDNKLIYTFHFYDPFLFTHQGATWVAPSLLPLANMPFPYRAQDMPAFPNSLRGSWMEGAYNNYAQEGTVAKVKQLIDIAAQFKEARKVPVYCGEFGVFQDNSRNEDRVFWYNEVRRYLEEKKIGWTSWDYHGSFGLFTKGGSDLFQHDLNVPLLQALGFTVPPQTPYVKQPEGKGFPIYTDFLGQNIQNGSFGNGPLDFYFDQKPNNGRYSLAWTGAEQYSSIGFDFTPDKDLSKLKQENYAVDFLFRGTAPAVSFDLRFIDTKTTDPSDHPWRSGITITPEQVPFDGRWHHVRLPLNSFTEKGSWDNAWFNPEGKFDWTSIDRLEITAEHAPLGQTKLWFDNLVISDQDTAKIYDPSVFSGAVTGVQTSLSSAEIKVYPNPAAGFLLLETTLPGTLTAELRNSVGTLVCRARFTRKLELSTASFAAGAYFIKVIQPNGQFITRKVMLQR
ncbi:cellulase family glycosylhydrolase [Rufibacter latericius]|uniref:T9SS C-terminal target domain-containing protein n=1 Tax=Rufibacter latericius TaxID=2487040 RepID=A0A3M9MMN1_9BACT|nr:cellulase family glycosylhydrolase [Rufibacter latericius]RNI26465.1 T9SS C-terminal target domain-containing protein [Rufibacter latericius]